MNTIEAKILSYRELSPEEREALESHVEANPEWASLLRDVKALEALIQEVRLDRGAGLQDEVLSYYLVCQHIEEVEAASERMQAAFDRVERRIEEDPDVRARYEEYRNRLKATLDAIDPVAQFEHLSGHALTEVPEAPSVGETSAETPSEHSPSRARPDLFEWLMAMPRAFHWATAMVLLVGLLYGGLYLTSQATQSEIDQLAAIQPEEVQLEGYNVRLRGGNDRAQQSPGALYRHALDTLRSARIATLGLFPRYDDQALAEAEKLLSEVIQREESGSFLQLEAYYFLGKVHLAQHEIETARADFKTVVEGEGRMTQEAAAILEELQRIAPSQKGAESYFGPEHSLPTGGQ